MINETRTVVVRPEPITAIEGIVGEELPTEVALEIDGTVPDKYLADAALDVFQRTFNVGIMKYIDIAVFHNGVEIFPAAEFDDGEFQEYGKVA